MRISKTMFNSLIKNTNTRTEKQDSKGVIYEYCVNGMLIIENIRYNVETTYSLIEQG